MALRSPPNVPTSARAFVVHACDGVPISGHRWGDGETALVFCHGFGGSARKPRLLAFQAELTSRFTVYALDFRGHGESGGVCTFGADEHLDVDAVVRRAREDGFDRVVTVGGSMGGIAVIRQAAFTGGVDVVATISAPARWHGHSSTAIRRIGAMTATVPGRRALRAIGARVADSWSWPEDPCAMVHRISPTPFVVVHGRDDHFFDEEEAWTLYRMAREPKRLLLASRFGHAEDGYSPAFAARLAGVVHAEVARCG